MIFDYVVLIVAFVIEAATVRKVTVIPSISEESDKPAAIRPTVGAATKCVEVRASHRSAVKKTPINNSKPVNPDLTSVSMYIL